jgi:Anti-sigma-K factor rskA
VLALDGLGSPPPGMTYQAWVVPPGSATPVSDASFDGTTRVVPLMRRVPAGARVGVTLEPSGGALRPSRPIRVVATRD